MDSKKIITILIIVIIILCAAIGFYYYNEEMSKPKVKTIDTKAFKFNTTLDDNWTFYKDHDDGYSYKNDAINHSKIRYYTGSIDTAFSGVNYIGWEQLHPDNITDNIYVYESHFDNEQPVTDSYHNYYSAFMELKNGGYVHVSSMDLNRTLSIIKAIDAANN